ncbi:hypothetical protein, partial [Burkholderia sp. JKS000303]|uniref:hypothetical protein n=1 Tax=Burkholderia sp. JKS000303 TaxID=1938747 RepID=UPI001C54C6E6
GATLVAGSSPGNYSLDTTTGLVTFVADNSAAVTGWTPGATTQFTVASVPSGWTVGKMLYFTGVTGTGCVGSEWRCGRHNRGSRDDDHARRQHDGAHAERGHRRAVPAGD